MPAPLDIRFQEYVFVRINRINNDGNTPVYWFSKPNTPGEKNHIYSFDKTVHENCYDDLQPGKYYLLSVKHIPFTRKVRHWIWVDCLEAKTKQMWEDTYNLWKQTGDIKMAVKESGMFEYARPIRKKKQLIKDLLDL